MTRIENLDSLRGLAIFIMIFANSAPYAFPGLEFPMIFRLIFSMAAPLFVFLSGYTLQLNIENRKSLKKILLRIVQVLFMAILVDLTVWNIGPFMTFDVLYIIAFSLGVVFLIRNRGDKFKLTLIVLLVVLQIILPFVLNYNFENPDIRLDVLNVGDYFGSWNVCKRFIWDGWFPAIPWLIFALAGSLARTYREKIRFDSGLRNSLIILFIVNMMLCCFPGLVNTPRMGYQEVFYPAYNGSLMLVIALMFFAVSMLNGKTYNGWILSKIGKVSLFVYYLHGLLIIYLFKILIEIFAIKSMWLLALMQFLLVLLVVLTGWLAERYLVPRQGRLWLTFKFILGL